MIYINYRQYGICFKNKNKIYDRLNGPAHFNGNIQIWYQNGEYHRLDGPAVIGAQRKEENIGLKMYFFMKVNIMKK